MRLRTFKYFINEGFKSFWINGLMSAASSIIVTASLVIFGIYIIFSMNINFIGKQLSSQYEIQVFLQETTTQARVKEIGSNIKNIANVKDAVFFSKAQALEDYKKQLGDSAEMLDGLELDNPLRDSYKVTLVDLNGSDAVVASLSQIANVALVKNNKDAMDKIISITSVIKNFSIWLMALLSIVSIFIISNTIKITVFARRRDINIMKYLGATDWFISWPFIVEGIIIGVIGAIIALILASQGYQYLVSVAQPYFGDVVRMFALHEIIWQISAWFAGIGIILGALGSAISLRRYLHV